MLQKASSFLGRGVFGTENRTGQDVAEYLFFIAVLVAIIKGLSDTITTQFEGQAGKLFETN
jgi:hypothetical protein